ncbi:hypothetical protein FJY63_00895, partial [Candidatus Sumerlaeota bacterium]|nr:hypothetical protein [Candidatus Sumerlaeota bacterium]
MHPTIQIPDAGVEESLFTDADRLVLALALDALDQCLVTWVNGTQLTDEQGKMFTATLMAAHRIVDGI